MKRVFGLLGALALALLPVLIARPALSGEIKVGLMCPLTGKWASEGQDMKNIVSLLVAGTTAPSARR